MFKDYNRGVHELSIAQNIVDIVLEHVPAETVVSVDSVKIRVGDLSGVVAESLEFCYQSIVGDTPLEGSRLDIERVRAEAECLECHRTFVERDMSFTCPSCSSSNTAILSGADLQVVEVVVRDAR